MSESRPVRFRRPLSTGVMLLLALGGYVVSGGPAEAHTPAVISRPTEFGMALACIGDRNGDGWSDAIVAAASARLPGRPLCGALLVVSGRDGALLDRVDGPAPYSGIGQFVDAWADFDGDGTRDIVAGCRRAHSGTEPAPDEESTLLVYSGASLKLLWGIGGPGIQGPGGGVADPLCGAAVRGIGKDREAGIAAVFTGSGNSSGPSLRLLARSHSGVARVVWSASEDNGLPVPMAGCPDLDGDGCTEVVTSVVGKTIPGRVRVRSGASGSVLWEAVGDRPGESCAQVAAAVGDINGDGIPDLALGDMPAGIMPLEDRPGPNGKGPPRARGRVVVHSGKDGKRIWEAFGDPPGMVFGMSVVGIDDTDGDGVPDVCVGARGFRVGSDPSVLPRLLGAVFVLSGRTGRVLRRIEGTVASAPIGARMVFLPATGKGAVPLLLITGEGGMRADGPEGSRLLGYTLDGKEKFSIAEEDLLEARRPR